MVGVWVKTAVQVVFTVACVVVACVRWCGVKAGVVRVARAQVVRTPAERFAGVPDYPFEPHYMDVAGVRVHYVDVGERAAPAETVLCVHGEPTWSFLYRHFVAAIADAHPEWRVVAPDFIGFGKSDKFSREDMYSHELHRDTLIAVVEALDLSNITLVVQDWGGLTGLSVVRDIADRVSRLYIMNTGLPPAGRMSWRSSLNFVSWRAFCAAAGPSLPVGRIMRSALRAPSDAVVAAYEAPFHSPEAKAGAIAWPKLVPLTNAGPVAADLAAARAFLRQWAKPARVLFSDKCPITRDLPSFFANLIPGAKSVYTVICGAGHFLQDDKGPEIAADLISFIELS